MSGLFQEFCEICKEDIILEVLSLAPIVESSAPAPGVVVVPPGGSQTFSVDTFDVGGMEYVWTLDGSILAGESGPSVTIASADVPVGGANLRVTITHVTSMVRAEVMEEDVVWSLNGASGFLSDYDNMNLAGTFNGWNATLHDMELTGDYQWQIDVLIGGLSDTFFKFVADEDWAVNWGDGLQSAYTLPMFETADNSGGNISVSDYMDGIFRVKFNENTLTYSIEYQGPILNWVGNVFNWPLNGDIEPSDIIWVNAESYPIGSASSAAAVYTTDGGTTWSWDAMLLGTPAGGNDHWYLSLGTYPAGTTIEYALVIYDLVEEEHWLSNYGANYTASVNAGQPVQWYGNVYNWPLSGSISSTDSIWTNIESWPQGSVVSATTRYTTDGWVTSTDVSMTQEILGANDHWYTTLGMFSSGTSIDYAIQLIDGAGAEHWDSNFSSNYHADIN